MPPLDDAGDDGPAAPALGDAPLMDASLMGGSFIGGATELSEDHSELVAQVVGDSGLLPPDKLEAVRARAQGGSFSRALLDEGFAHSLGVARNLAEQYHMTLVDLAVEGVNAEAAKMIPLPVLERVCAIPFAFDGKTLRDRRSPSRRTSRASTSSASRRATRRSSPSRRARTSSPSCAA